MFYDKCNRPARCNIGKDNDDLKIWNEINLHLAFGHSGTSDWSIIIYIDDISIGQ
jgi:hypothetical protein